ncbi:unnamed protein product [Pocillopora meandrina]|uniref:Uncharacterized protein n=1 Tax=Pocillopora meandrina TaxID=46732 RepID=A0AAU9X450_9CNID|nr:unnamed protein product [Pocillopora meandrina]
MSKMNSLVSLVVLSLALCVVAGSKLKCSPYGLALGCHPQNGGRSLDRNEFRGHLDVLPGSPHVGDSEESTAKRTGMDAEKSKNRLEEMKAYLDSLYQ